MVAPDQPRCSTHTIYPVVLSEGGREGRGEGGGGEGGRGEGGRGERMEGGRVNAIVNRGHHIIIIGVERLCVYL